ncbi:hypothetical protein FIBSPDRAFT_934847 [Athelia psychrophila]|uniref:Uncharacterized protein n=1 Tax=Athelia psychrophila TaxID=1759441 RepID=A0A166EV58_9AGAM|nr:hypothetical protein FIBSPDRAFT_934847 [Fibularhizoctonia sp. CBS 109695]
MIRSTSSIDLTSSMAQDKYPARGRAPRSSSTSSIATIREPKRGRGVAGHGAAEESSGRKFSIVSPRSATDNNSNADASEARNKAAPYEDISDILHEFPGVALASTLTTGSGNASVLTPQPPYLRTLYRHSLPGHVTFIDNRDPSVIEGIAICNRDIHPSPLDATSPHHVWAARLYLITTEPSTAPSPSHTFIDMDWTILDDENGPPRKHRATYRGAMSGQAVSDIQSPTGWQQSSECSKRTWALDFDISIPRDHWTHTGRSRCSLIASVVMGTTTTATHTSISGGDRATGSATHLHHKLPIVYLAV